MILRRAAPRAFGTLVALWLAVAALAGCGSGPTQIAVGTQTAATAPTSTAATVPPTSTSIPAGWSYYLDPQYQFSLDVPSGWSIVTSNTGYYEFQDYGTAPDRLTAWFIVNVTDIPTNFTPNPLTTTEMQFCTSAKTTTVTGFPAVVADHSRPMNTLGPAAVLERLFVANGLFYDITFAHSQVDTESLDTLQQHLGPLYAQFLASFQPGPGDRSNVICPL